MPGHITTSDDLASPDLAGTGNNPARDPKPVKTGKGSIGDRALMDALIIVALAWAVLILLAYSLRHHNI